MVETRGAPVVADPAGAATGAGAAGGRPPRAYFPAFEGLRAIAAVLVLIDHVSFASGFTARSSVGIYLARGEIGVGVFFLISAFLLYRPFVAANLEAGQARPHMGQFLLRRALRILPLYWVALTVTYLFTGWDSVHGVAGIFQTYFFAQVYTRHTVLHGITQAWSLDVEVVFYLCLPLWAMLVGGRRSGRRAGAGRSPGRQLRVELLSLAALYATGVLFRWFVIAHPHGATDTWHGWIPQWFDFFALGMMLAVLSAWYGRQGTRPRLTVVPGFAVGCWALAAVAYWFVSKHVVPDIDPLFFGSARLEMERYFFYGLFAMFLLLPAVFTPPPEARQGPIRWLLTSRPFALTGLVSYGVYLWHQLVVIELLRFTSWQVFRIPELQFLLAVFGITLAISTVTYFLVERPGIGFGSRWVRRWRERQAGF